MAELTRIVALLQEQRRALLDELEAIDTAIAALDSAGATAEPAPGSVLPTQVKSRRTQTDAHKHAIAVGKRRARHARDAAKGLVREAHAEGFVPAIGSRSDREPPRLVRRPKP